MNFEKRRMQVKFSHDIFLHHTQVKLQTMVHNLYSTASFAPKWCRNECLDVLMLDLSVMSPWLFLPPTRTEPAVHTHNFRILTKNRFCLQTYLLLFLFFSYLLISIEFFDVNRLNDFMWDGLIVPTFKPQGIIKLQGLKLKIKPQQFERKPMCSGLSKLNQELLDNFQHKTCVAHHSNNVRFFKFPSKNLRDIKYCKSLQLTCRLQPTASKIRPR